MYHASNVHFTLHFGMLSLFLHTQLWKCESIIVNTCSHHTTEDEQSESKKKSVVTNNPHIQDWEEWNCRKWFLDFKKKRVRVRLRKDQIGVDPIVWLEAFMDNALICMAAIDTFFSSLLSSLACFYDL